MLVESSDAPSPTVDENEQGGHEDYQNRHSQHCVGRPYGRHAPSGLDEAKTQDRDDEKRREQSDVPQQHVTKAGNRGRLETSQAPPRNITMITTALRTMTSIISGVYELSWLS